MAVKESDLQAREKDYKNGIIIEEKLMNIIAGQDAEILGEFQEARDKTENMKESISGLKEDEKNKKLKLELIVIDAENKKREIEGIYNEKQDLLRQTRKNKEELIKIESTPTSFEITS